MGLEAQFSKNDVRNFINRKIANYKKAIESRLIRTGEDFVTKARDNGEYLDQTGNLRSSIGYILLFNGNVISRNFQSTGGQEGVSKATEFAENLIRDHNNKGFVLICVAGMDYASSVESKGKDVITGTSQIIEVMLKQSLRRIKDR